MSWKRRSTTAVAVVAVLTGGAFALTNGVDPAAQTPAAAAPRAGPGLARTIEELDAQLTELERVVSAVPTADTGAATIPVSAGGALPGPIVDGRSTDVGFDDRGRRGREHGTGDDDLRDDDLAPDDDHEDRSENHGRGGGDDDARTDDRGSDDGSRSAGHGREDSGRESGGSDDDD